MKKYPVTYNNETYEVRWWHDIFDYIRLYKVYPNRILFKKKHVYTLNLFDIDQKYLEEQFGHKIEPKELYIYQAKMLLWLYKWEQEEERCNKALEEKRKEALAEWNGVIKI